VGTVFMDGSVQTLTDEVELDLWRAINARSGGEPEGSGSL
jgi:hypothetical protein